MGSGGRLDRAFFDVRVFNRHAPSNQRHHLSASYRHHKNLKNTSLYEQSIRDVEHGSFTPLIFSVTGRLGRIATTTYKRLASMLSSKRDQPYSTTMAWLRYLSLSLCFGPPFKQSEVLGCSIHMHHPIRIPL